MNLALVVSKGLVSVKPELVMAMEACPCPSSEPVLDGVVGDDVDVVVDVDDVAAGLDWESGDDARRTGCWGRVAACR